MAEGGEQRGLARTLWPHDQEPLLGLAGDPLGPQELVGGEPAVQLPPIERRALVSVWIPCPSTKEGEHLGAV